MEYVLKGFARAIGQGFAFYVLLPLWYASIKISDFFERK